MNFGYPFLHYSSQLCRKRVEVDDKSSIEESNLSRIMSIIFEPEELKKLSKVGFSSTSSTSLGQAVVNELVKVFDPEGEGEAVECGAEDTPFPGMLMLTKNAWICSFFRTHIQKIKNQTKSLYFGYNYKRFHGEKRILEECRRSGKGRFRNSGCTFWILIKQKQVWFCRYYFSCYYKIQFLSTHLTFILLKIKFDFYFSDEGLHVQGACGKYVDSSAIRFTELASSSAWVEQGRSLKNH